MPSFASLLLGKDAIFELMEARMALEAANASIAATRRTDADLAAFRQLLHAMQERLGDEEYGEAADIEFHRLLAQATHNAIMMRLLETISSQMESAIRDARRIQLYGSKRVSIRLWEEHEAIYQAVEAGDSARAEAAMRAHLAHVEQVLRAFLH